MLVWTMIVLLAVCVSGCSVNELIGTALSAGAAYGISQAFKK